MKTRSIIAASILAADFSRLGEEIKATEKGGAGWIHVDVMDGQFVPNIAMGPHVVQACKRVTDLPLDVHLMIETPEKYLSIFAQAGASRLTVHVEACPHLHHTLQTIQKLGVPAGIALNPGTPLSTISEVLDEVELILIMTVNPGFGGQELIPSTLTKVRQARQLLIKQARTDILIEVDGGIDTETIHEAGSAGANVFVAGTSIFKNASGATVGTQNLAMALEGHRIKK